MIKIQFCRLGLDVVDDQRGKSTYLFETLESQHLSFFESRMLSHLW